MPKFPAGMVIFGEGGLGRALARNLRLQHPSNPIFITTRRKECREPLDESIHVIPSIDICNEKSIEQAATEVAKQCTGVSLLINCIGLLHANDEMPERTIRKLDYDFMLHNFRVNAIGPALIAKHFFTLLAAGEPSKFVNLSARIGSIEDNKSGGWISYRASKAAQNQITKTLSHEFKRKNITCLSLHPGTVDTALSKPFRLNPKNLFTADDAALKLISVIDQADIHSTGRFYDYAAKPIPW